MARDEYLFGPDLLAAPVVTEGATIREVQLPAGDDWIELADTWTFDEAEGGVDLAAAPASRTGGKLLQLDAPLDELTPLARRGALLPLLPRDVDIAATYDAPGVVRAVDAAERRELLAFPSGTSTAAFGSVGESLTSTEGAGRWSLAFDSDRSRTWSLQASLGTLQAPFTPCVVSLDGRPLTGWTFDAAATALRLDVEVDDGTLVVAGCRG